MTEYQKGKEWMRGAISAILDKVVLYFIICGVLSLLYNSLGWGTDNSDQSGWKRSGMRIYTDYKTNIQYLATSNGGLIERK